jgi:CarD family transcriptional regulator
MTGGGLFGTVEVLKGLHALSRVRPLPQKERELYDNARHLLVGEIAAAMNIPLHVAEDNLDYALWPPEGMKRKGRPLPPATLGPPSPARVVTGDDDDLGFDDEELGTGETAAVPGAPAASEKPEEDADEEEEKPVPAPAAKKAAEKEKPKAAHRHETPAPKKQKPSHPPAKKAAPPKKAAAKKPAAKHPAKKAAPAKRPAARASAKGKR